MPSNPGLLARVTRRSAATSARFPRTVILLWLLLVAGFVTAGALTGTKSAPPPARSPAPPS